MLYSTVLILMQNMNANRFTIRRTDTLIRPTSNHTPGVNALLAPSLTLQLCPLPHGVFRPTQQRVPIASQPE
jgi:hypothetical protein